LRRAKRVGFRVVVNGNTRKGTVDGLVKAIIECADELGY